MKFTLMLDLANRWMWKRERCRKDLTEKVQKDQIQTPMSTATAVEK